MRKKLRGGCSCGKVRYQLLAVPIRVHCCHCTDCQRHTGSAFVINAIIETSAIKIMRGALEAVPVRRSYGPHDIYRCRKCKVAVWSDYGHRPQIRFVRVGTLDDPNALRADAQTGGGLRRGRHDQKKQSDCARKRKNGACLE